MNVALPTTTPSYMKAPRAHYRIRGGRILAGVLTALFLGLMALMVQVDRGIFGAISPQQVVMFVLIDLALLLVLLTYAVAHRATLLWRRAHDGVLGTRLQSRIILVFSAIAIVPTLVVATFAILFFNVGIKTWFETQVSSALQNSITIATAYIDEHKDAIRNDAISMGEVVHNFSSLAFSNPGLFASMLSKQAADRNLSEAIVFDRAQVLSRTALSFSLMFERLPEEVIARADNGKVAVFGDDQDKIQAVIKISRLPDIYLMVVRVVDPKVLDHMHAARETVNEYHTLQNQLVRLQSEFFVVFVLVAMLVLLASLWAGMYLAVRLIEPLRALLSATERVRGGDYSTRVPEGRPDDEIANLGRTFNRMTGQLDAQRRDLMDANRLADERRRFTEAVLSGVSAGIIALDAARCITLHNRTALELLERTDTIIHEPIATIMPEVEALVMQAEQKPERIASGEVVMLHADHRVTLHVQVTAERFDGKVEGYIVTFDDITTLVAAQRSAAWADVARRIAHEIKNPLTPISLSAERLRKKFGPDAASDERESYDRYLDTISRHVRDIGRMVEEFVAFARLPASQFREENLVMLIRKSVFSAQTVHPEIKYRLTLPEQPVTLLCDESQMGQALLNLLKNAAEAMEPVTTSPPEGESGSAARSDEKIIRITLSETASTITLTLSDNGPGFPPDKIATLTEPYVTTRVKGTGLGLAIVKRTIEEHKGELTLTNPPEGGACVTLVFTKN